MKNPFNRSVNPNDRGPNRESYQYKGSRSSNKLIIVAGIVTFIIIVVVMFESVVVVQAGHR
jgi:prohibitin 2